MMFETLNHVSREGSRGAGGGPRFFFLVLLLLLGGLVVAKAIRRRKYGDHRRGHASAARTLQDRFARGEIGQAEYDHRKAVLDGADVIPPAPQSAPATRQHRLRQQQRRHRTRTLPRTMHNHAPEQR